MKQGEVWFVHMNEGKRYMVVLEGAPRDVTAEAEDGSTAPLEAVAARAYAPDQIRLMRGSLFGVPVLRAGDTTPVVAAGLPPGHTGSFVIPTDLLTSKFADNEAGAEVIMSDRTDESVMVHPATVGEEG